MSSTEREAALKALRDAEAALAAAEKAVDVPDVEPVAEPSLPSGVASGESVSDEATKKPDVEPVVKAKYLDLGPEYLGPVAINGT